MLRLRLLAAFLVPIALLAAASLTWHTSVASFSGRTTNTSTFSTSSLPAPAPVTLQGCSHITAHTYDATIAWTVPAGGAQSYELDISQDGGAYTAAYTGTATSATVTSDKQSTYSAQVIAIWGTWRSSPATLASFSC